MDKFGVKIADGLNIVTSHGGVNQTKKLLNSQENQLKGLVVDLELLV